MLARMSTSRSAVTSSSVTSSVRSEVATWFGRGIGATAGALLVVALATGILAAGRATLLVFVAVLLGAALDPLVDGLRARLPIARGASILVVYVAFFAIAVVFLALVVPGTIAQAGDLVSAAPAALERARAWAGELRPAALSSSLVVLIDSARDAITPSAPPAPGEIISAGMTVADALVSVITVLALVFFWMTERARLQRFALSFLPAERRAGVRQGWGDIEARLGAWVRGQLLMMGAIALMTGTACLVLGLPSPLLLGILAGLAELIPMVGPAIGTVPALLVAATIRPEVLLILLAVYVVIHFLEGNVLVPLVMGNAAGISPFLVIASLLVGGSIGGLLGALIAVPAAASIEVVLERLQDRERPVTPIVEGNADGSELEEPADPRAPAPVA